MATGVINFNDGYVDTPSYLNHGEVVGPYYYAVEGATGFTTPYRPAVGYYARVDIPDARWWNVERQTAFSLKFYGPSTPFYLGPTTRTATGSGLGSETAVGDVIAVVEETATGSGAGTGSATGVITPVRTATGSGAGDSTTTFIRGYQRTATGSGTGTAVASANPIQVRIATGTGTGTSAVTQIMTAFRTATGSGVGTSTASSIELLPRTATGSGEGATGSTAVGLRIVLRAATGSGTSTQSATKDQLYLFRTPTDDLVRWANWKEGGLDHALFKFYAPGARGRNVYKLTNGTWTENDQADYSLIAKVYYGGHDILVDATERAELEAAGYGAYVS